jgi:glycosyltransferase involved in cell wall biosynthesis
MKIVFLNDLIYAYATDAPSAVGGAERQQWLLARGLAAAGWEVTVGVRNALQFKQRVSIEGVEFVGMGQKQFLWAWHRFIVSERPEWWYWRCASHLLGPVVAIAKLAGVRTIFSVCFDSDVNIRHALFRRSRWWPLYALGLLYTDRIFVQHEKQLLSLPARLRAKACLVPSMTTESKMVKPHSLRGQYVAWVAMFWKSKRPDLLIEIARNAPENSFIVCGGPNAAAPGYGEKIADTLQALPNVDYRGQVAPDEANRVIANAALFLSTSAEEGFPNTFLQAWAAGTPVVTLRVDPDHVVERYGLGKISPTVDQAICDIRMLLDSEQEREAISSRARKHVAENHGASDVIRIFERDIRGVSHKFAGQSRPAHPL